MAKKKKGQRADGLIEIARKMPDGKTRHFYGHSRAACEDKYRRALGGFNPPQGEPAAGRCMRWGLGSPRHSPRV